MMQQYLLACIPVAIVIAGWVISVERRITTLQAIASDIHEIKGFLEPLSKLFNVASLINIAKRDE